MVDYTLIEQTNKEALSDYEQLQHNEFLLWKAKPSPGYTDVGIHCFDESSGLWYSNSAPVEDEYFNDAWTLQHIADALPMGNPKRIVTDWFWIVKVSVAPKFVFALFGD